MTIHPLLRPVPSGLYPTVGNLRTALRTIRDRLARRWRVHPCGSTTPIRCAARKNNVDGLKRRPDVARAALGRSTDVTRLSQSRIEEKNTKQPPEKRDADVQGETFYNRAWGNADRTGSSSARNSLKHGQAHGSDTAPALKTCRMREKKPKAAPDERGPACMWRLSWNLRNGS